MNNEIPPDSGIVNFFWIRFIRRLPQSFLAWILTVFCDSSLTLLPALKCFCICMLIFSLSAVIRKLLSLLISALMFLFLFCWQKSEQLLPYGGACIHSLPLQEVQSLSLLLRRSTVRLGPVWGVTLEERPGNGMEYDRLPDIPLRWCRYL